MASLTVRRAVFDQREDAPRAEASVLAPERAVITSLHAASRKQVKRTSLLGGVFRWDDPFLLEEQLSEEERLIRDSARRYAPAKLARKILESNRHEHDDRTVFPEMGEMGFREAIIGDTTA
jgi:hypothetical protein